LFFRPFFFFFFTRFFFSFLFRFFFFSFFFFFFFFIFFFFRFFLVFFFFFAMSRAATPVGPAPAGKHGGVAHFWKSTKLNLVDSSYSCPVPPSPLGWNLFGGVAISFFYSLEKEEELARRRDQNEKKKRTNRTRVYSFQFVFQKETNKEKRFRNSSAGPHIGTRSNKIK